jgi:hypothetical protein
MLNAILMSSLLVPDRSTDAKSMPMDCRGTLRRTVRSRNNRIATVRVDPRLATITVQQLINHREGGFACGELRSGCLDAAYRPQTWPSTPEFPDREVRAPLRYGGGGWLTESMTAGGGLAASAGAVARMIGQ